jgi:putative methyltransferase
MSMKNIYLWNKSVVSATILPTLWFSAKTYHEEYGKTADHWLWQNPFIHLRSIEEVLEDCKINPPTIFGFSLYLWNHVEADTLAQEIKKQYPKCLIIYGGPQVDIKYSDKFFQLKPWVDLVVPSDVYGEPLLSYILDNFDNLKVQEIPEVYYHRGGIKFRSKVPFVKRSFTWPSNIFEKQKDYINIPEGESFVAVYETTRGCPYGCTYCDWGGGTYTKVVRKPMATILSELEFLSKNKVEYIYIADANFGIYKDDINIINHIVDLKEKYGYPLKMSVENAKNNLDRVVQIQELLVKNQLVNYYKISIQNTNDEIKKNIDRVDIPFNDQLNAILELKKKYNVPILIETILGLPGDNYKHTLESIDIFHQNEIESHRPAIWNLLPEAPAYAPAQREKFKIKTKWFEVYSIAFRYKNSAITDEGVNTVTGRLMAENVISTYSYSEYEWCDMLAVNMISGISATLGFNFLTGYLNKQHDLSSSVFYDKIYKELLVKKNFTSDVLNEKLGGIVDHLYKVIDDDSIQSIEFDVGPNFPMWLAPFVYVGFIIMLYPKEFFTDIGNLFTKITNDEKIVDLCMYLANIIIDIDYDPVVKRTFQTNYNWYSHFNDKKPLLKSKYEYKILDERLKFTGTSNFEISDYHTCKDRDQKIKQFFYHRASNAARKKYAEHIIENEVLQTTK